MSLCAVAAGATFNVVDFGARVTDCLVTTNIQAAIDACHRAGGGEVVGEVKLVGPVPKQPVTWLGRVSFPDWGNPKAKLSPPITGELPGVLAYEWKSGLTGQRVLLFANLTSKEQSVAYMLDGVQKSLVLAPRTFKRMKK